MMEYLQTQFDEDTVAELAREWKKKSELHENRMSKPILKRRKSGT